ncbi:RcnB family protein [Citromicrobium bathyomarinum]
MDGKINKNPYEMFRNVSVRIVHVSPRDNGAAWWARRIGPLQPREPQKLMYDLSDLFRYGGLSAIGLALSATGLPASAAVTQPQPAKVTTFLGMADAGAMQQPAERSENRGNRRELRRESRQQRREARQQQRRETRQQQRQQARQQQRRASQPSNAYERTWEARRQARENYRAQQSRSERREARQDRREARRDYRRDQRRETRQDRREARRDYRRDQRREARREARREYRRDQRREARREYRRDQRREARREYRRDQRREARRDYRRWNRSWRNNNRYNWRHYRAQNRRHYNLGRYYAPYRNYSYRRLSIGFTLGSLFFGNRYWINDPWSYRLPQVYGPYKWVRYYDDVLLVNTYSGEVVDVIYDFFW